MLLIDAEFFIQAALAIVGLCFLFMIKIATARHVYNIVDYQAAGNGRTDDTQVISSLSLFSVNIKLVSKNLW